MAKNITLMGASYSNVPAVQLPQTGGGTARFDDASVTTATASDVASGKVFLAADGTITTGTNSGGGADIPTFTVIWDDDHSSVISVTCDKTFAECDYSDYGVASVNDNTQSGGEEDAGVGVATIVANYGTYIYYTVYFSGVYPYYDIRYNSNGTISVISPTQTYEKLNVSANGTYYPQGGIITEVNVNVSGGGGASNYVSGSFTPSGSGVVGSLTIPYSGNGYPICAMVFVKGGAYDSSNTDWYNSTQRYAVGQWTMHKAVQDTAPTYSTSGTANYGVITAIYKNSTSSSTSYTRTSAMNANVFSSSNASNAGSSCVRFKKGNVLSYYVASTSYGLMSGVEYEYHIVYSE